jgi:hypothetical protein
MKVFQLGADVGNQVRDFFASIAKFCTDMKRNLKLFAVDSTLTYFGFNMNFQALYSPTK